MENLKETKEYYEKMLVEIKKRATDIYEKISSEKEENLEEDKKFIKESIKTVADLMSKANYKEEDFLLELQSYLMRIDAAIKHIEEDENDKGKKKGILHRYKYTILKTLLDLEYEIGTI